MKVVYFALVLSFCTHLVAGQGLLGTWEFVSAKVTQSDGTVVDYTNLDLRSNKILNSNYFCVVTRNADGSFRHAILGPYRVEGDLYTEILEYSTIPAWTGSRPVYQFTVEGDLWTIRTTGTVEEKREEVWRRISEPKSLVEF